MWYPALTKDTRCILTTKDTAHNTGQNQSAGWDTKVLVIGEEQVEGGELSV